MNLYQLPLKNLKAKKLNTLLNVILFALGIGIITVVLQLSKQLESQLERNQAGIGMVVGAKGSPLQLILCAIFHVDFPTGNIKQKEVTFLEKHPLVSHTIPQALGDSYQGYRIVGTTTDYVDLYEGTLSDGKLWEASMEVTLGAKVAKQQGLKIGDTFHGSHGMGEGVDEHENHDFKVVGILAPTQSVLDQLILTGLESVWDVHKHEEGEEEDHGDHEEGHTDHEGEEDHDDHDHEEGDAEHHDHEDEEADGHDDHDHEEEGEKGSHDDHDHEEEREITTLLVKFRSPMGSLTVPRMINEQTNLQAASPAFEVGRLFSLLGVGVEALEYLSLLILVVSGLSVFINLYNSLKERKYELAYLRVLGVRPFQLFALVLLEGSLLALLGFLVGDLLGHLGMHGMASLLSDTYNYSFTAWQWQAEEFYLAAFSMLIGLFASLFPAWQAYRTEVSQTLAEG